MRKLYQKIIMNQTWRRAACRAGILLYTVLFCIMACSDSFIAVSKNVSDRIMMRGISRSDEICVVAVTQEDTDYYGIDGNVLAAMAVKKLNENVQDRPAVLALELPASLMSEEGEEILKGVSHKENLILPAELTIPESAAIRAPKQTEIPSDLPVRSYDDAVLGSAKQAHIVRLEGEDGILRHMTFQLEGQDGYQYPSMAQACFEMYCHAKGREHTLPDGAETFSVIIKYSDPELPSYSCSVRDLLEGTVSAGSFAGKIVLVGSYDTALDPGYRPSIDHRRRLHSAQADAEIINGLLEGGTAYSVPLYMQIGLLAVCVFVTALVMLQFSTVSGSICYILIYSLLTQVVTMLLFGIGYGVLGFPHMANGVVTSILFTGIAVYRRSRFDREQLEKVLGKYVDNRVAGGLLKGRNSEALTPIRDGEQDRTKKVAVLFADIRGFTSISEKVSNDRLVRMLNDYLSMMSSACERYGGTVDKFIGDCVMAYWGAPEQDDDPVYHACLAAAEIRRRAGEAAKKMCGVLGTEVKIGIGISYGDVVAGAIGSSDRLNYTVIGDTVNVASRLESLAPGGCIYLSAAAAGSLNGTGELEKLPEKVQLKGMEKAMEVYSMKSISVRGNTRRKLEAAENRSMFRRRGIAAMAVNFLIFLIQFVFVLNNIRSLGIGFVAYLPVSLAALSSMVHLLLIPFDLRSLETADGTNVRPRWLDVAMLSALVANVQNGIMVIVSLVPLLGFGAYSGTVWPGGFLIYLLCPVLSALSFFALELHADYSRKDMIFAELPLAVLLMCNKGVMVTTGMDTAMKSLYNTFYRFPLPLIAAALQMAGLYFVMGMNRFLRLQDRIRLSRNPKMGSALKKLRHSKFLKFVGKTSNRAFIWILLNLLIAVLSLRVTVGAWNEGGVRVYSNPSLIGIVVSIACFLCVAFLVTPWRKGEEVRPPVWYRYASFIRTMGCMVNFFSVLFLAISGEGIAAFFTPRWCADASVFLLCPAVSMIMWLLERNEYRLSLCFLSAIPYAVVLPLSAAAVQSRSVTLSYEYEIENFYSGRTMVIIIICEFLLAGLMYLTNLLVSRMLRESERDDRSVLLHVCGGRSGITGGRKTESRFGLRSECYVLVEGNYGIVIGAGSGLQAAAPILKNCTSVDILVGSADFSSLMGFLMMPDVCPGARVRILSPFGAERFMVNPFWPVNLIRKACVTVPAGTSYRLNDMYSVHFFPAESGGNDYMIRLEGDTTVCCTGSHPAPEESVRRWCLDADLLIYNAYDSWTRGCYIAIDNSLPDLLLSGAPVSVEDEELEKKEQEFRKLFSEVKIAGEGTEFRVRR